MEKHIKNEQTGIHYTLVGDYYLPNLTLPQEKYEIGSFGQQHLRYLKEQRRLTYTELLASGRLNAYLHEIDTQARKLLDRLVKEYTQQQGVTERLKAENQMEWVGRMNNIRTSVAEVVRDEIICN